MQVKAGLIDPAHPNASREELQAAWDKFVGSLEREASGGIQAVIDFPATESVGIGMHRADTFDDIHGHSDPEEDVSSSETEDVAGKRRARRRIGALRRKIKQPFEFVQGVHDVCGVVFMEVQAAKDLPPERNGTITLEYKLTSQLPVLDLIWIRLLSYRLERRLSVLELFDTLSIPSSTND